MKRHIWAIVLLALLTIGLLIIQFRHPLALNFDGGYNAANTEALMHFQKMPFSGSPILPFGLSAFFGLAAGSASAGIKIATTLSLVATGLFIYLFIRKVSNSPGLAVSSLAGWCISLGVYTYIAGYLKQTIALPFVVGGLIALWFAISEKKWHWWVLWGMGLLGSYLCHTPSVMVYLVASVFVASVLFWMDGGKRERTIAIILWVCIGLGLISIPWSVPFLSKYVPQLSLGGWRTIWIYIKGLFSYRYQMTTDFSWFDIPMLLAPVVGFVLVWFKNRKLALWYFAFGAAIMLMSLFAVKYEWQGRNVMTFLVPIAMLSGSACWLGATYLAKYRRPRLVVSLLLAISIIFMAGWHQTLIKYVKDAKPIITTSQLDDLGRFLGRDGTGNQYLPTLYARHGLRFWSTYATKNYTGVLFYDWDRKTLGIRQSRSGEELGASHTPAKGEYLLISKLAIPAGTPSTICSNGKLKAKVPQKVQEYLAVDLTAVDKMDDVWLALRDENWNLLKKVHFGTVTYGTNRIGLLLTGVSKGQYWVQIGSGEMILPPAKAVIEENLLWWAQTDFVMKAQSPEFIIIEAK
jgi:hypothetical protein